MCHQVVCSAGHNTLPDIIGPFFLDPKNENTKHLYFALMLALLRPWQDLWHLKSQHKSFGEVFDIFISSTTQEEKDIISGIQYYYDCRNTTSSCQGAKRVEQELTDIGIWDHTAMNSVMEMDKPCEDNVDIQLMETNLELYEESRKNQHKEQHGLFMVSITHAQGIISEQSTWHCLPSDVSIAQGDDFTKLHTWQEAMDDVVAHINGDDEESINGDGTESNSIGDVCWMDDVGHKEDENGV